MLSHTIDHARRLIVINGRGYAAEADYLLCLKRLLEDPGFDRSYSILGLIINPSALPVLRSASALLQDALTELFGRIMSRTRVAVVLPAGLDAQAGYSLPCLARLGDRAGLFGSRNEALDWLLRHDA